MGGGGVVAAVGLGEEAVFGVGVGDGGGCDEAPAGLVWFEHEFGLILGVGEGLEGGLETRVGGGGKDMCRFSTRLR